MADSGILLIKYWLEVDADEQTRRLEARINDPRKVWKLSDMDLKSYSRWYDYSRARDAMLQATDTAWAPWYIADTSDKRRGRLNIISHLLEPDSLWSAHDQRGQAPAAATAGRLCRTQSATAMDSRTVLSTLPSARDRVMAAISLLAAAAAVLVVVVAALDNRRGLVVALLGAVVVVGAGWTAVSRRGAGRAVALLVAAGGLALLLASIGIADVVWWRALGAAALGVLSMAAARSALHTGIDELQAAPTPGSPVPAAVHPVLLMNPKSGGGKAVQFDLAGECAARGIQAVVLRPGDDMLELAENAIAGGADVIGMAGGDGSQALIATVASRHGIPHVVRAGGNAEPLCARPRPRPR